VGVGRLTGSCGEKWEGLASGETNILLHLTHIPASFALPEKA